MMLVRLLVTLLIGEIFVFACEDSLRKQCNGINRPIVDENNCNVFYQCSKENQTPCPTNCMEGLGFDESLGFCNWKKLVQVCSSKVKKYYCPGGYYCPEENVKIHCPLGSCCQPNSTHPQPCPAGYFCLITCGEEQTECKPGKFCPNSPTDPILCPPGLYCPTGSSEPVPCPCGTYNPSVGGGSLLDCIACPEGNYFCPPGSTAPHYSCDSDNCEDVPTCKDEHYGNLERERKSCDPEQRFDCQGKVGRVRDRFDCSVFYSCDSEYQFPCPSVSL